MQAGLLNTRLLLQEQNTTKDGYGQAPLYWDGVGAIWANVRYTSGLEAIRGSANVSTVQASVRIRYRARINTGMRLLNGATVYNIKAVLVEPRKKYIDLVCEVINAST